MDPKFAKLVESLHDQYEKLLKQDPVVIKNWKCKDKKKGIYLFSGTENKPLYVGRTNNVHQRYRNHYSSNINSATFAIKIARNKTGHTADYTKEKSAATLIQDASTGFREEFNAARDEIKKMKFRFVEEADPTRQALLEIYCAVVLGTTGKDKYNDFDTH